MCDRKLPFLVSFVEMFGNVVTSIVCVLVFKRRGYDLHIDLLCFIVLLLVAPFAFQNKSEKKNCVLIKKKYHFIDFVLVSRHLCTERQINKRYRATCIHYIAWLKIDWFEIEFEGTYFNYLFKFHPRKLFILFEIVAFICSNRFFMHSIEISCGYSQFNLIFNKIVTLNYAKDEIAAKKPTKNRKICLAVFGVWVGFHLVSNLSNERLTEPQHKTQNLNKTMKKAKKNTKQQFFI